MNNLHPIINSSVDDWILSLAVVIVTFLASIGTKTLVGRANKDARWKIIRPLAPSISSLVYLLGLKVLIEVAPFHPKVIIFFGHIDYVLTVIVLLNLIRHSALIAVEWTASRGGASRTLHQGFVPLFKNIVTLFVLFSGTIMVLKRFNYDVMSLLTALGVGSLAVGLAAKDTLSNMISGFTLIIDRNLKPGDRLNLGGMIGDVEEIGLRSTRILLGDGNTLIVPNAELVNTKILNLTLPSGKTLCTTQLKIPYSVAFDQVRDLCVEAVAQQAEALPQPPATVNLTLIGKGCQEIHLSFWVAEPAQEAPTLSCVHQTLLKRFRDKGIPLIEDAR